MLNKDEIIKEEKYLEETLKIVRLLLEKHNINITKIQKEFNDLKYYIWNNQAEHNDEDFGSIVLGNDLFNLDVKEKLVNDNNKRMANLTKSLNSPYFAKLTFSSDETFDIYIGLNSIEKDNYFYVYDWRSNIASMYYNYELGDASYNTYDGVVNGKIINKRQFNIKNGKLINVFDNSINIDDEFLQDVLSKNSNSTMKNIVSSIQKEQNKIIRNITDKYLVVEGTAGCGKTSVALHRIAYLLYKEKHLNSNNILIFSPNDIFIKYISNVLPSLGEENVLNTTFKKFAYSVLNESEKIEDFASFVERNYNNINDDIKYKLSFKIKDDIDKFYEKYISKIEFKNSIKKKNIITKEELNDLLQVRYNNHNINDRLDFISEFVCRKLRINIKYKDGVKEFLVNDLSLSIDIFDIYNSFLKERKIKEIDKNNVLYEDITLLIYIYFKVNGIIHNYNIKHVLIDEVQDYTKLQLFILKSIFSKATFTILGDINQVMIPYFEVRSLKELLDESKFVFLNKTYRSTEKIINYSNKILNLNNVCCIRNKNCDDVLLKKSNSYLDIISDINDFKSKGYKTIAVITKTKEESFNIFNALNEKVNITLIEDEVVDNVSEITVLPVYLSKGLEFDAVIIYNDLDNNYKDNEKNLLYIASTRALHSLIVYNN